MLKRLANFIIDRRKAVLIAFLALTAAAVAGIFFVRINYDLSKYLPEDAETTRAMKIMNEEFGDGGALTVMADFGETGKLEKQIETALAFKNRISAETDSIESVVWLIDAMPRDIFIGMNPVYFLGSEIFPGYEKILQKSDAEYVEFLIKTGVIMPELSKAVSGFFDKDTGQALYQITFSDTAYAKSTVDGIRKIKELANVSISGPAATAFAMQSSIREEVTLAIIIIAPILLLIFFLATSSFFDPVVLIAVIAVPVIMNMGTNFIFGSVSFLTNSVAVLLQVAISMDYAIFFLHAYKAERKSGLSAVESAKGAFRKAFRAVSASSLTTIACFGAMLFMSYKIGIDMGLVIGKGIILSLIAVFFFMPCVIVFFDRAISSGEHRSVFSLFTRRKAAEAGSETDGVPKEGADGVKKKPKLPLSERFTNGITKTRYIFGSLFALLIVPSYFGQRDNNFMYGEMASSGGEGSKLQNDRDKIELAFGSQNSAVVLIKNEYADKEAALVEKLSAVDKVSSVQSAASVAGRGEAALAQFVGKKHRRLILAVDTGEETGEAFKTAGEIRAAVDGEFSDVNEKGAYYLVGGTMSTQELRAINQKDFRLVTFLTLAFIMAILFITFKGVVLPVILGVVIQSSIWFGMSIPYLLSEPLVYLGYLIVSCVQMGATIDYGILLSSNYMDFRKTMGKFDAAKRAFRASVGALTTSASILSMVGFAVGISGTTAVTSSLGLLLGRGTILSYILMTFILPQLLVIFDKPIMVTTIRRRKKKNGGGESSGGADADVPEVTLPR